MPDLGTAYVQIVPSAKGISGSIQKAIGGEADAAGVAAGGKISGKIKGVLAAAGIGAALGAGISKSISEGANLEQAIGGIETLFKDSSDQMIKNADNAFKTAGISANQYMEQATSFSASLLQSTGGDTQKAAKAADQAIIDMSDNANKMGSNITDIQNAYQGFAKQNYTMLDNLKLGYGGTKTEMERLLSDAEKISGQKYDISNLSDVYEAIHVIQTDLDITGTSSKEAASTLSGSFASMKAAAENLMGDLALGRNVGPAMVGLAETASTYLFGNLLPAIGRIFASLPTAISALVKTGLPQFMSAGAGMVRGLIAGVQNAAPQLAQKLPQMVSTALNTITQNLPAVLDKGRQIVVSLVQGLLANLPTLINAATNIAKQIPDFLQKNIPVVAAKAGELAGQLGAALIKNLPKIVVSAAKLGLTIVTGILKMVPTMLKAGKNLVMNLAKGLGGAALSAIKGAARKIVAGILTPISAIGGRIRGYANTVRSVLSFSGLASKVRGIWNSIKSAITGPIDSARNTVSGIVRKIKGFFPISVGKIISNIAKPHIPSIGVTWKNVKKGIFSLSYPSIHWNAKAMDNPYMFNNATLFGAGEAGDEMLYGRKALMADIREATGDGTKNITINNNFYIDGAEKPERYAKDIIHAIKMEARTA